MLNPNTKARIQLLLTPILVILLGAVLVFRPDSMSALVAKILGYILVAAGILFGVSAVSNKDNLASKVVSALACVFIGGWLLKNPLRLAAGIGRIIGILMALRGVRDLRAASIQGHGTAYALVTAVVGVLLVIMPMTASRLVMAVCGIVVVLLGIAMLLDRLRYQGYPHTDDSNIIDAL